MSARGGALFRTAGRRPPPPRPASAAVAAVVVGLVLVVVPGCSSPQLRGLRDRVGQPGVRGAVRVRVTTDLWGERDDVVAEPVGGVDPNADYLASLSPVEREAYAVALTGTDPSWSRGTRQSGSTTGRRAGALADLDAWVATVQAAEH